MCRKSAPACEGGQTVFLSTSFLAMRQVAFAIYTVTETYIWIAKQGNIFSPLTIDIYPHFPAGDTEI